jgi:hypothetical protein
MRTYQSPGKGRAGAASSKTGTKGTPPSLSLRPLEQTVLELQRNLGNAQVASILSRARLAPGTGRSGDERRADQVAIRALDSLPADAPVVRQDALSQELRAAIRAASGRDPGRAPVVSDELTTEALRAAGAEGGAVSGTVLADRGVLADRQSAPVLLAHEGAHLALGHRAHAEGGNLRIPASLQGASAALVAQGGAARKDWRAKIRARVGAEPIWNRLLAAVQRYEETEKLWRRAYDSNDPREILYKLRPKLTDELLALSNQIESLALAWQQKNDTEREHLRGEAFSKPNDPAKGDLRAKSGRAQAVAMLLPRIRDERRIIQQGGKSPSLHTGEFVKTMGGGVNTVTQKRFAEPGKAPDERVFKRDVGYGPLAPALGDDYIIDSALTSGIPALDPGLGARDVAMSRLDRALGTNVVAKTDFATTESKTKKPDGSLADAPVAFGSASEVARGLPLADLAEAKRLAPGGGASNEPPSAPGPVASLDDPLLQRKLNALQVVDALSGQVDRHGGNFLIDADQQGKVTSVTGVDNDLAFGSRLRGPQVTRALRGREALRRGGKTTAEPNDPKVHNFSGLPELWDEETAAQVLAFKPEQMKEAIGHLVSEDELAAALERLEQAKAEVRKAEGEGRIVKPHEWGPETAWAQTPPLDQELWQPSKAIPSIVGRERRFDLKERFNKAWTAEGKADTERKRARQVRKMGSTSLDSDSSPMREKVASLSRAVAAEGRTSPAQAFFDKPERQRTQADELALGRSVLATTNALAARTEPSRWPSEAPNENLWQIASIGTKDVLGDKANEKAKGLWSGLHRRSATRFKELDLAWGRRAEHAEAVASDVEANQRQLGGLTQQVANRLTNPELLGDLTELLTERLLPKAVEERLLTRREQREFLDWLVSSGFLANHLTWFDSLAATRAFELDQLGHTIEPFLPDWIKTWRKQTGRVGPKRGTPPKEPGAEAERA